MPLNGTLQDLSLPSLIQLQCGEQRPAEVRLIRRGREAVLGFANGELVHARVGSRTGEQAVYELVGWEDAAFEVVYTAGPLEQNVFTPWTALLLEGMRLLDEARAERNPAYETLAQELAQQRGVQAAVVLSRSNTIDIVATDEQHRQDGEWIAEITAVAQSVGDLLALGELSELLSTHAKGKLWVDATDDALVVGWLDGRAAFDPLRALVATLSKKPE